ncbi:A32.5L, partial [Monkeypox virus]
TALLVKNYPIKDE